MHLHSLHPADAATAALHAAYAVPLASRSSLHPHFATELERARSLAGGMMQVGQVPLRRDPGGGYTHDQDKSNLQASDLSGGLLDASRPLRKDFPERGD